MLLDGPERLRAERFMFPQARNEFVFGRALLRRLLAACLIIHPSQVAIAYGPHGKPRLMGGSADSDLRFNIAHSESLIAVAITRGREVGIDIESTTRPLDWSLIAERVFSQSELCQLRSLHESEQNLAFLTAWTRKEAFLKATGEGLSDKISTIDIAFPLSHPTAWPPSPTAGKGKWEIHPIPLPAGFCGALVVEDPADPGRAGPLATPHRCCAIA